MNSRICCRHRKSTIPDVTYLCGVIFQRADKGQSWERRAYQKKTHTHTHFTKLHAE